MGKSLVIVESPAKAKTINKYLGKDYIVKSSVGHIRDLPTSGSAATKKSSSESKSVKRDAKQTLVNRMGVDPYHQWQAHYEILPGKEKVVSELKALAETSDLVYLATDLDREGEAIAWHLQEIIGGDKSRFRRVVFNEITKNAIQQAFHQPGEVNVDRVNAQQARRFMDRVVGYMVSPLLWKKVARGLSAGRVQSVAVRLVVERERAIKSFIPQEYWELNADLLTSNKQNIQFQVAHYQDKPFKPVNKAEIDVAISQLSSQLYTVVDRENKPSYSNAPAPFITSTLQQAASTRLSFGVKKTMMLAQRLYESGYITYMRTDSTNLSQDAVQMVRGYIESCLGKIYLPDSANVFQSKGNAQEAHEAIRPSDVYLLPAELKNVDDDGRRLYEIIWQQFVACQMTAAKYDASSIVVESGEYTLKVKGKVLKFDGWTKVLSNVRKSEQDRELPDVNVGEQLNLVQLLPSQHFTKPPARFSEASLVKELEKRGIGRPSTYASIISTIQERGYVHVDNRRFYAEKMGEIVTDRLEESFKELMDYDFTAKMEDVLDDVATGKANWIGVLDHFFNDFNTALDAADKTPEEGGMRLNPMVITSIDCPTCSRKMGIRTGTTGVFLGCSGYELPVKERCKQTINLIPEQEVLNILEGDDAEANALRSRRRCPICSTAMDSYLLDTTRKLHICGNNPQCQGYEVEEGSFRIKGYDGPIVECDKCGSPMHLKLGRFGKYMDCTNEECKNTRKILRSGEVAPPKEDPVPLPELLCEKSDAYFILRDGASGIFLAAHNFPKSRETRAPLVEELVRFKERLPEKLRYLAQAPVIDPQGNKTIVRFSRKTKQQYVMSEKEGKATGWTAFYVDNQWVDSQQEEKKNKKKA